VRETISNPEYPQIARRYAGREFTMADVRDPATLIASNWISTRSSLPGGSRASC
jgi:hypothetical protein